MSREHVQAMGDLLRRVATHHADQDWEYTRDLGDLRPLHFGSRWPSIRTALRYLVHGTSLFPNNPEMRPPRWQMARAALRSYDTRPDGALDNGCVITIWEETGEYLQLVQPSVGEIVAQIMIDHPDLPLVQALAGEIDRINERYARRILGADAEASP